MKELLYIENLCVNVMDKIILDDFNFKVNKGEVHVIMGPNGAGKSTFANVILNNPIYKKIQGRILFDGKDISDLSTDKIAKLGIFMSFQSPIDIPGITNKSFLRYIAKDKSVIDKLDFYCEKLNINKKMLLRNLNVGFSGGEKKKNEILQMLVLNPKLAILDETDSGLDTDAIKAVINGIKLFKNDDNAIIIITHNTKILNGLDVDFVHVLKDGKIIKTGDINLAYEIDNNGYLSLEQEVLNEK